MKSVAPIVMAPQACALGLGAVRSTVVPHTDAVEGQPSWRVAPVVIATLSCDHRVVDGAVGASWLAAFKGLLEEPETLLL